VGEWHDIEIVASRREASGRIAPGLTGSREQAAGLARPARQLLSACRVGGQDAGDPRFREALERLNRDRELAKWFAEEQSADRKLAERIRSFPVPPGLKSRLLANARRPESNPASAFGLLSLSEGKGMECRK
jgi:hypothetical protein